MDNSILGGTAALKIPFRNPSSFRTSKANASSLFLCLGRASAKSPIILTRATLIAVPLHLRVFVENLYIIFLVLIKAAGNSVRIFVYMHFVPKDSKLSNAT